MATLEIHDDRGRIQRVLIGREHPALFGSSPECDIVLGGPNILPVHGRLRWKRGRYKVDAAPEAHSVERNGKKVTSASFRIGDEVRVGQFRIYMVNPADGPLDDKTRVQAPPTPPPLAGQAFESAGWLRDLEVAAPSVETAVAEPESSPIDQSYDRAYQEAVARREARAKDKWKLAGSWWRRIRALIAMRDQTPGQERIISSPLVLSLMGTLVVLVLLGFSLRSIIVRTIAQRQYMKAVENLDDGEYRNAIAQFEQFLKGNPQDPKAGKARVLQALANVRQYALGGTPSWTNAFLAARSMVTKVGREPAFRDESTELAELVLKIAEGLADRAKIEADAQSLAEAEKAVSLHAELAGRAAGVLLARSRAPAKIEQARAAVRKSQVRVEALAAMDAALERRSAAGVYAARDQLAAEYADLAADRAVGDRLTRANELIRSAVTFDPSRRPGETEPRPERLGPPTSLVFRSSPAEPASQPPNAIVYALAEGFAYGLDGATGAPVWHIPVGVSSPFAPLPIAGGEPAALVFDARHDELLRISGRTGSLIWRQSLEEPIVAPPLVLGNQAVQATPRGNLLFLDLASGELTGTLHLGRPLAQTPVSDEAGQFFYLLADEANLFVVKRDPLTCTVVEYTGHAAGSILCPPARIGRYLIVAENQKLNEGRWMVYELSDEGAKVRPLQRIDVPGWTWGTPTSQGAVIWAVGDRGGPAAFSIGEEKEPLRPIARIAPDLRASGPAFARTRTEREVWIASSRSGRYDLNAERGSIAAAWTLTEAGPALAPIQVAGRLAVFTQQALRGPGVELWGVDPDAGSVRWRTVLGNPWPLPPTALPQGSALTTLATNGQVLELDTARLVKGGFVEQPLPRPGVFALPPGPLARLDADGATLVVPAPNASHILIAEGSEALSRVDLPAPLAARPLLWGSNLLVPGGDSRVYLIDPKTGASRAEPLVPPFDREHPIHWLAPARLDADTVVLADEVGSVRRLALSEGPKPKLVVKAQVNLGAALDASPVATETAIFLATTDGRVRALAARDLSPLGAWSLDAPRALGPVTVGGHTFVADNTATLIAFGPDGQRLWSIHLQNAPAGSPPIVQADTALLLGRDGSLETRSLADGSARGRVELGIVPAGGLEPVGPNVVVPVAPGTVRLLLDSDGATPKSQTDSRAER